MTTTNGVPSPEAPLKLTDKQFDRLYNLYEEMTANITATSRQEFFRQLFDHRRDIDEECGYPRSESGTGIGSINPELFRTLYEREGIATRVVQVFPMESWSGTPTIYEDEDPETTTEFEEAWDNLSTSLQGEASWFADEKGSPIWDILKRADILSGIGHFGVILLGIDDGKNLDEPIDGTTSLTPVEPRDPHEPPSANAYPSTPSKEIMDYPVYVIDTAPNSKTKGLPIFNKREQYTGGGDVQGTDAQYLGVQLSPSEYPEQTPGKKQHKLLFLQCFDESLVQIVQYEANKNNPRFGMPVMYRITLNDPREMHSGIGLPLATVRVHWSRIIHLADNLGSSKVFGVPRQRPVLNRLLDLRKIYGADAEAFWKAAFMILSAETHPELGGDVRVDKPALRNMFENMMNSSQRWAIFTGMALKSIAPQVVDPSPHIDVHIQAICIELGIPLRIFMGSERGELASSQDDGKWNDRIRERQNNYLTPRVIVPFVNRLILIGVLPEPEHFFVDWPNLDELTETEKADIAQKKTAALATFAQSGAQTWYPEQYFLTRILGEDEDEANEALDAAKEALDSEESQTPAPLLGLVGGLTGTIELFKAAAEGAISEEQLKQMLMLFFKLTEAQADKVIADGLTQAAIDAGDPPIEEPAPPGPMVLKPGDKAVNPLDGADIASGHPIPPRPTANAHFQSTEEWVAFLNGA